MKHIGHASRVEAVKRMQTPIYEIGSLGQKLKALQVGLTCQENKKRAILISVRKDPGRIMLNLFS
jgi:hypothetical protein